MERIFRLDKTTAPAFQGLHPQSPETWFGQDTAAMGVIRDGKAAGLLLSTVSEQTVWLDWLFVAEEYRGQRIGSSLLYRFSDHLRGYGGDSCVHAVCGSEMKPFLENMGFDFPEAPGAMSFTAPLSEVRELPPAKESDRIRPLYTLSEAELNRISYTLGSSPKLSVGIKLPVDIDRYMSESAVYMDEEIRAMLFLEQNGEGIGISYAYAASAGDGGKLLQLLSNAKQSIENRFWKEIGISATALNEKSEEMIRKLMPTAEESVLWEGSMYLI